MSKIRIVVAAVVVVVAGLGWVSAQSRDTDSGTLTGQDYGEIEALYARYSQGSDFRNAELFVSAFSEDATIVRADGSSIRARPAVSGPDRRCGTTSSDWELPHHGDPGRGERPRVLRPFGCDDTPGDDDLHRLLR